MFVRWVILVAMFLPALARAQADSTLTLEVVEREVIAHSPSLLAATQTAIAARARAEGGGAWDDPELSFSLAPGTLDYRVGVRQRIGAFGEQGARALEAGARFDAEASNAEATKLDVLREARAAFAEYRRTTQALIAHQSMVELANELRHVALAKYAAGAVEQQDPLSAGVEAARLAHHAVKLESEQRIAIAQLNTLLGRPADAPLAPPANEDATAGMAFADLDSLVRLANEERPESQAAISRVAARAAGRRVAQLSGRPGLMLGFAYDRMWEDPAMRAQVELGVTLPLWGGAGARKEEAEAELAAAQAEQRAWVLRIGREVVEAVTRYDEAAHDLEVLDGGVLPAATQGVTALRASYEANRASFLALLEATRTLADARLDRIDAEARLATARADLARALGDDGGVVPMGGMR